ncbi:MAG TPA: UDP-3-O-(3-hydroxymyristoyl)glucosamine N-acyltransferase, partial [Opitutales bacterium]|nr:UDP-3-O-(3-hydroxymyristoyl)glucosamine N-acyltransferase [Opitutales bacterium]
GELSFLGNKKYTSYLQTTQASIILVPEDCTQQPAQSQVYIVVKDPSAALGIVCAEIEKQLFPKPAPGIHPTAQIGVGSIIMAQCYIGRHVLIGAQCELKPRVTVMDYCELSERVSVHSGTVIGSDGFGYTTLQGIHHKEPQVGRAVVEKDVEIGSNVSIDRARFSVTRIGEGTKIDNLVQIAHNVIIGPHSIIVAQVGIAGSTTLGHHVVLGGQVGIAGHLKIGDQSMIGAQSGINCNIEKGAVMRGTPAQPAHHAMRLEVYHRRLPELFSRVNELEDHLGLSAKEKSPKHTPYYA